MYESVRAILNFLPDIPDILVRRPELIISAMVVIAGAAYLYWPGDPFDIREAKDKAAVKSRWVVRKKTD